MSRKNEKKRARSQRKWRCGLGGRTWITHFFDRNTGRRLHPFDFRALAFKRHGFNAKKKQPRSFASPRISKLRTSSWTRLRKPVDGTLLCRAACNVPMRRSYAEKPCQDAALPFLRAFSPAIATLLYAGCKVSFNKFVERELTPGLRSLVQQIC